MSSVTPLPTDAIIRLAKLLGMLGSEHIGERAAAGLKATELLRAHGRTWADMIEQFNAPAPRQPKAHRKAPSWRAKAECCLDLHDQGVVIPSLTTWEYGFLNDILERGYALSEKQEVILDRISGKMGVVAGE